MVLEQNVMKIALKLPLAAVVLASAMVGVGLVGIRAVDVQLGDYVGTVQLATGRDRSLAEVGTAYRSQVQEWKNTLLRGRDPVLRDKHWSAFAKLEAEVNGRVADLVAALPPGEARTALESFATAHRAAGERYRAGYETFVAADFDPVKGDLAVRGNDRDVAALLADASDHLAAQAAGETEAAIVAGNRAAWIAAIGMLVAGVFGVAGGALFARTITRPLARVSDALDHVAGGDLVQAIPDTGANDEIGMLMHSLARMRDSLNTVVAEVRRNADSVATASGQIAMGNNDLSARTEHQASALEQTTASMEELGSTVTKTDEHAGEANRLAQVASEVAVRGGQVVGQVVETMQGITESSHKIADIIGVIDGIAFQTNILALNAAVEAARAGEQGRGFAVVATEVRTLAQRSAQAAREIKDLISTSVQRVEQGTMYVGQAGSTMQEIVQAIERVTSLISDISAATHGQSLSVSQVRDAVATMDQSTQQNAALVEQSAAAAEGLKHQAEQLVQSVAVFKLA